MESDVVAVLDANVLYSFYLRELLMRLSKQAKLFQARWSHKINQEWARHLKVNSPHLKEKDIEDTIVWMNKAIPEALIDPEPFMLTAESLGLPDPKDAHVVAAALASQAQVEAFYSDRLPIEE